MEMTNINGLKFTFHSVSHHKLCKEFILESPGFNVTWWLVKTTILSVIGFLLELQSQDTKILFLVLFVLIIGLGFKLHRKVTKESLLVIASLGVQLTTTFASGRKQSQFVDIKYINDIVINEGITMHRVIFYLVILLKDDNKIQQGGLLPLFQNVWPRFYCLQEVYSGIQMVLFNGAKHSYQLTEKKIS